MSGPQRKERLSPALMYAFRAAPSRRYCSRDAGTENGGAIPCRSGALATKAETDGRGVTHITAPGLACGGKVAVERVLSADH